jgi:hypothetical protein
MDFVGPFPESSGHDYLWVVICRLTSMVHLVPIKTTTTASELAWLYIREIVRLHGLANTIVSDRDSKFMSRFWHETHKLLGTKLLMSTSFHPQTDGASERAVTTTDVPFLIFSLLYLISLDPITFHTILLRSVSLCYFPYVSTDLLTPLLCVPICGCVPLMNSDSY